MFLNVENASSSSKVFAVGGYCLCNCLLLLANKIALSHYAISSVLAFIQIIASIGIVLLLKYLGKVQVDEFEWGKVKAFSVYTVFFASSIYANMRAIQVSNPETVLVFRACSPLAVAFAEHMLMNRAVPSMTSSLSLVAVAVGAAIYCVSDSLFHLHDFSAYTWLTLYVVLTTCEIIYGKILTEPAKTSWTLCGLVLYQNSLVALPMFIFGYAYGDYVDARQSFLDMKDQHIGYTAIVLSCVIGTAIGCTSWASRAVLSATSFALVDVINKLTAVLMHVLLWGKPSSPTGLAALCFCLLAGVFYQQDPRREYGDGNMEKLTK